jgi:hypothetical protein
MTRTTKINATGRRRLIGAIAAAFCLGPGMFQAAAQER